MSQCQHSGVPESRDWEQGRQAVHEFRDRQQGRRSIDYVTGSWADGLIRHFASGSWADGLSVDYVAGSWADGLSVDYVTGSRVFIFVRKTLRVRPRDRVGGKPPAQARRGGPAFFDEDDTRLSVFGFATACLPCYRSLRFVTACLPCYRSLEPVCPAGGS